MRVGDLCRRGLQMRYQERLRQVIEIVRFIGRLGFWNCAGTEQSALHVYNWGNELTAGKWSERGATRDPLAAMQTSPRPQSVQKRNETRKPPPPAQPSRSCCPAASPGSAARGSLP